MRALTKQSLLATSSLLVLCLLPLRQWNPTTPGPLAQTLSSPSSTPTSSLNSSDLPNNSTDLNLVLQPRAFLGIGSSAAFKRARNKGRQIVCAFSNPAAARRTGFDRVSDLADWGWESQEWPADQIVNGLKNFKEVLDAKGLISTSPPLVGVKCTHSKETTHDGVKYPATGGQFIVVMDVAKGLIVPARSYGPAYYVRTKLSLGGIFPLGAPLPRLSTWADVAYLSWLQRTTPGDGSRLKWAFNINCQNATTQAVVAEALKRDGVKDGVLPKWPGHVFEQKDKGVFGKGNSAYEAVLGTPNLLGSGWLVVQHQEVLGAKRLGSVTVYDSSGMDGVGFQMLSVLVEVLDTLE